MLKTIIHSMICHFVNAQKDDVEAMYDIFCIKFVFYGMIYDSEKRIFTKRCYLFSTFVL